MEKILVTGIDGFTGTYIEKYLTVKGFKVYGTVIGKPNQTNHLQCDITKKAEITYVVTKVQPDYVIHTAAISFVGESNATSIYNVNVLGSENLLTSLVENNLQPKKIILASSAVVYGNQRKEVLDETMCPTPINHYGCSKLAMEHISSTFFDKLNIIITRPFNYTGPGQAKHFLIPKIVKHFKEKKKVIELGNLDVAREFNDIRYVVDIYYKLLMSDANSTIVNISTNNPIKLMDVIQTMNEIAGYEIEIKTNPKFIRKNEIQSLAGSTKKLESLIQLDKRFSIKETLLTMYES